MNASFGTKLKGQNYRARAGAYAVPIDEHGHVALVEAPIAAGQECRLFLIGGGLEPGESGEECVCRECLEETGHIIEVREALCTGDEYLFVPGDQCYLHATGTCYRATLGGKVREAVEKDHTLHWISVEDCYNRMFLQYQAWAVKMAWENKKKENEI